MLYIKKEKTDNPIPMFLKRSKMQEIRHDPGNYY